MPGTCTCTVTPLDECLNLDRVCLCTVQIGEAERDVVIIVALETSVPLILATPCSHTVFVSVYYSNLEG